MSPGRHVVNGLGLWLMAWALFSVHGPHGPPDDLSAAVSTYNDNPSCRGDRVLTDAPDPTLAQPSSDQCVIQGLVVANKYYKMQIPTGHQTTHYEYWITVLFPWGGQHSVMIRSGRDPWYSMTLTADRDVYDRIVQGQTVNALMLGQRVAVLAVGGRAISTADDPKVQHGVEVGRQLGVKLLLGLGLLSLVLALRGAVSSTAD
jgi:hypothetical protein